MERPADERREILRTFINERALKIARWAKDSGVSANSIYNFLNGESDGLSPITYGKLARTAEVPVWRLSGDQPPPPSPTTVYVKGHVEAGEFREAIEWDRSEWYSVDVPLGDRFRGKAKALEVRGGSMNQLFPEGSVVIWVECLDFRAAKPNDIVVVYSYKSDDTIEATVKRLVESRGELWLQPESLDPDYSAVRVSAPGEDISHVEIRGIVIGSYTNMMFDR